MKQPNIEVTGAHPSPAQTATYTYEMLESLRKLASQQGFDLLSHLLEVAAMEARHQAKNAP